MSLPLAELLHLRQEALVSSLNTSTLSSGLANRSAASLGIAEEQISIAKLKDRTSTQTFGKNRALHERRGMLGSMV